MMPPLKTLSRPCPICGQTDGEVLHTQRFALPPTHPLPASLDVVACARCGFAFADTPAPQAAYDRYYAEFSKYEDDATSTGGGGTDLDAQRLRDTAARLVAVLPEPRAAAVLDLGCANGGLLAALHDAGCGGDLVGVDPSPACVAATARRPGLRATVGWLLRLPADLGRFDLVILSHVLEHVADLRAVLATLPGLLRPGGRLYLEVPDAARYADCLVAPFQDFNVEHINHFDLGSLCRWVSGVGLTLERGGPLTLEAAPGCPYPAVFGLFHAGAGAADDRGAVQPVANRPLRERMREYVERSREMMDRLERTLAPLAAPGAGPIIVWGTGQLTLKLLTDTSLGRAEIAAFVDGNPLNQGKTLAGRPVLPPARLAGLPPHPILVATLLHGPAILARIHDGLRLPNRVVTL